MAAPKENQFWKLRSTHGRDRIFADPPTLLEECQKYFNRCDAHPYYKNEVLRGGDKAGKIVKVPMEQPYTMHGLCVFLGVNTLYFNQFEKSLEGKEDDRSKDFSVVITHVREVVYQQKFRGAAVGAFNHNIIARDLGLQDKIKNEMVGKGDTDLMKTKTDDELEVMLREVIKKMGGTGAKE